MTTLIICPACETRYQIKAAFPPEGRKVRCAKCGHVWQAQPAGAEAAEAAPPPPPPQAAAPEPAPPPPPPSAAPEPAPPPPPPAAASEPAPPPQAMPVPPPSPVPPAPPVPPPSMSPSMPSAPPDADFTGSDALAEQVARMNEDALQPPGSEPAQEEAPKGGLFGKLMGRSKKSEVAPPPDLAPPPDMPPPGMAPPADMAPPPDMAPQADMPSPDFAPPEMTPPTDMPAPQSDAAFDAGFPEDGTDPALADPALADPDLVAAAFGEQAPKESKPRKQSLVLAVGWGALALVVLAVLSMFALAPSTMPGASYVYALLGVPIGNEGLAFEGVRHEWTNDGQQTVLEVQGNIRNTSSSTRSVPAVVIALRDANGEEISEWQTEVEVSELAAGEETPFLRQIPSPPSNVTSLKVRFTGAN